MKLEALLECLAAKEIFGTMGVEIQGLAYHSQSVKPGFLFAAIRGWREDGRRFISDALSRGASSLLLEEPVGNLGVTQVIVPHVREALAWLSSTFYGDPSLALTVIGITGTNGKTTTSYLIESILGEAGKTPGVIGTVNYRYRNQIYPAPTTTPESLDLQRNLHSMREAGVTHAILEVSSHALDMQRVRGCAFDVALFTNLTRDHLDYHGSMENYFQAKELLFTRYLAESRKPRHFSIINLDDPKGADLIQVAHGTLFRYGIKERGEIWPLQLEEDASGLHAQVNTPRGILKLRSPLIGRHNVYNILAAVSVAEALEIPAQAIAMGIEKLSRIPGRLERIPAGNRIQVFVDYAHTGDALARALETLRRITSGRLMVVFGCGGDRDRGKRPVMGKVAATSSDLAVLTSDNPRTEDPLTIIEEVEKGMRNTSRKKYPPLDWIKERNSPGKMGRGYVVIPDRKEAIDWTIEAARPGDVVLIAGKGHEDYQILGEKKIHFDDREEAVKALASKGA